MKIKEEIMRDKMEGIIHAYAVNHYNAKEGDWGERRRVRNIALDDLEDLFAQQKQEIVSGKFFNEITINEKVKIPKELLGYIEKEVRQKMINIIPGEIMDEDSDYYTGWNACIRTIREHLT